MATISRFPATGAIPVGSNFPEIVQDAQNRITLAFDATTDETCEWTDIAPQSLTGTLTLVVSYYMASATSGSVRFQAQIEAVSDGDALDLDSSSSFDTANSAGATVPGTQGYIDQLSITMTNADSLAAGDIFRVRLNRDADGTSGTDDATGDCYVLFVELRDGG